MSKRKITDINLYSLLEVPSTATEQEIKKAYRKKALKVHPDKNPDNPQAATLFVELADALTILTDTKAREAYDRTLKAKELQKERNQLLDAKRRKLKDDLERREREAKESATTSSAKTYSAAAAEQELLNEIERLRREGSRVLKEQQDYIRSQLNPTFSTSTPPAKTSKHGGSSSSSNTVNSSSSSTAPSFEDFEAMVLRQLKEAAKNQQSSNPSSSSPPTSTNNI